MNTEDEEDKKQDNNLSKSIQNGIDLLFTVDPSFAQILKKVNGLQLVSTPIGVLANWARVIFIRNHLRKTKKINISKD